MTGSWQRKVKDENQHNPRMKRDFGSTEQTRATEQISGMRRFTCTLGFEFLMVEGLLVMRAACGDVEQRLGEGLAAELGHCHLSSILDPLLIIPHHDACATLGCTPGLSCEDLAQIPHFNPKRIVH